MAAVLPAYAAPWFAWLAVVGAAPVTASPAAATTPRNLVATASLKTRLRAAHVGAIPAARRAKVHGPLKGSTYYGSFGAARYAIATFSVDGLGATDQPELFSKAPGKAWRDRGDTGGCISSRIIPAALLRLWGFERDALNPPCYTP